MSETTETKDWVAEAERVAHGIRRRALELTIEKDGCYLSQALSSAETLAVLYTRVLNIGASTAPQVPSPFPGVPRPGFHPVGADYNGPRSPHYDRLLLSAAHYAVAVYAALVETGRMAPEGLEQFNTDGSSVEMIGGEHSPGMELTTGSFGQALSQAGGIALARRAKGETGRAVVFMSDGELEEGQAYEGVQALAHYGLDNVVVYVDVNGQQVDGATKDVMNVEPLTSRLEAFGAAVETVDGHDVTALEAASRVEHTGKPLFVLAYTDGARGVPLLEARKPYVHFVRFKSAEEKAQFETFLERM
ncbi:MAG: 1-deoxy-D-xylulose-5-phosphate synthase N-terminal domain-containing protein [Spirochaetota bacterium]